MFANLAEAEQKLLPEIRVLAANSLKMSSKYWPYFSLGAENEDALLICTLINYLHPKN